jgi:hypothetical protein
MKVTFAMTGDLAIMRSNCWWPQKENVSWKKKNQGQHHPKEGYRQGSRLCWRGWTRYVGTCLHFRWLLEWHEIDHADVQAIATGGSASIVQRKYQPFVVALWGL